ncbi:hypothetical protein BDV59DRAFT_18644 [Aspergillus ambiguus]|uniref:C2H2-type zinc finger protein n=1 Tax=Aspergillus ambiguus TaxID=176160 RepID=UPI003CCCA96A
MASCKASFVSILNNDDNPAFAVRSSHRSARHHSPSSYPYPPTYYQSESRYGRTYESRAVSPMIPRPASETTQPASPGSSDCSYDYMSSTTTSSYYQSGRPESHVYPASAAGSPEKRLSANSGGEPPSPPASIGGTKDALAPKPRKNKYPCPFAASHGCSATFTTSGHAARHGKKHTGEKSVHCPICNKAFTRKDNMKQHIRTHRTHSEEMQSDGQGGWTARRGASTSSYNHSRSVSQIDGNAYDRMTGMTSMASGGSRRAQHYGTMS